MGGPSTTEDAGQGVTPPRAGQGEHDAEHGGHPQQEQEELLQQHAGLVLPLTGQKKLHRRPGHLPVPQQVDEVDDDRRRDQRQAPPQQRLEIE